MDKKDVKEDLKMYSSLKALKDSDGGKLLIKMLKEDMLNSIEELSNNYRKLTIQDFVSISASMSERLSILKSLSNSKTNLDMAKECLEELEKEE